MTRLAVLRAPTWLIVVIAALAELAPATAAGQVAGGVTLGVQVAAPTPFLADWTRSPAFATLIVTNTDTTVSGIVTAYLYTGQVAPSPDGGLPTTEAPSGTIPSDIAQIPSRNCINTGNVIYCAPSTTVYTAPQIARWTDGSFTGSVGDQLNRTGRLAEGAYTLCVQATQLRSATGGLVADATTCASFVVSYPQPPRLILPADQSSVVARYPTFQWTPVITPGAAPPAYLLTVVEMLPGQTPLEAVTANVPMFEYAVPAATALVYPPSALPLEAGKRYAWRVQAVRPGIPTGVVADFVGATRAIPVGANEGRSEIFTFTVGTPGRSGGGPVVTIQRPSKQGFTAFNTMVTGTLDYTFDPTAVPAPTRISVPGPYSSTHAYYFSMENAPPQGYTQQGGGGFTRVQLGQVYGQQSQQQQQQQQQQGFPFQQKKVKQPPPQGSVVVPPGPRLGPLAGVTVRLVVHYRTGTQPVLFNPVMVNGQAYTDNNTIVATTTTGADGKFSFFFHDDHSTGILARNAHINWGSGDVAHGSETGTLVRYYTLEVGDGHFLNPSDEIATDSTGSREVGTLVSLVRSYHLVVKVVKQQDPSEILPAVTVQVLRLQRPSAVPPYEGPSPDWPRKSLMTGAAGPGLHRAMKYEVLGEGETDAKGMERFDRLVKNVGPTDQYYVRVSTPSGGLLNYQTALLSYAQSWPMLGPQGDLAYFNEQYDPSKSDTLVVKLVPQKARYVARLMRADTLVPLAHAWAILCYGSQITGCVTRALQPKDDGYVEFSDIQPERDSTPPFWRLIVGADGFRVQTHDSLALLRGTQSTNDVFYLKPDAHVAGRIVDEEGQPIGGNVRVDDGAWSPAKPAMGNASGKPVHEDLSPQLFRFGVGGQQRSNAQSQRSGQTAGRSAAGAAGAQAAASGEARVSATGQQGQISARSPLQILAFVFDMDAVSGTQHLRIDGGPKYFPLDTVLNIPRGGPTDLGTFTLYRREHRLRVFVSAGTAGGQRPGMMVVGKPLGGAVVTLSLSGHPTDTTDARGMAEFLWESDDSTVSASVAGPAGSDYRSATATFAVPESTTWVRRGVTLPLGTAITGRVFAGSTDSVPVPGARVALDLGSASADLDAVTDSTGHYVIHAAPIGTYSLIAGKAQSSFVGESLSVVTKRPSTDGVNFHLKGFEGMDITHLLGFPLEVYALKKLGGGKALIRGALVDLPANAAFAPGVKTLPFDSVTIRSDGTPAARAVPVSGTLTLRDNGLPLQPFGTDAYVAEQYAPTGLVVRAKAGGTGAVYGPIALIFPASFTAVTSAEVSGLDTLWLLQPGASGAARTAPASITADSSTTLGKNGWNVGTAAGGGLAFKLYGFRVTTHSARSYVTAHALRLDATLHTDIKGVSDLAIRMARLRIVPGSGGGVQAAADSQPVSFKLGRWTLDAESWYLSASNGTLYLASGTLLVPPDPKKPRATIAFPFAGIGVTPTALGGGNFGTGPIELGGIVPMKASKPIKFVMEKAGGPWTLTGFGGTISGLPGMDPGSVIALDNFSFRSDGSSGLTPANDAHVRYYHTADFAIKAIGVTETAVEFNGNLDLHVPNLGPQAFIFTYSKAGGGAAHLVMPSLNFKSFDVGGASISIRRGRLDAKGFTSDSTTLTVTGKWSVPVRFTRTPLNGTNRIAAVPQAGAQLAIGAIRAHDLTGGSKVANGRWSTGFKGKLDVNDGEATGPFTVDVAGANVDVGSTGLNVRNISTPFGNVTITLNFPEQRIEGTLQMDHKQIAKGATATGGAELVLSGKPSNRYWYFFAGAHVDLQSPKLGGTVAIVIGSTTLSGDLLNKFSQYSTKGVPAAFHTINGFFFDGKISMPVPICPNGDIDVGVASISIWCTVWADLRLGANFQQVNTYHIGLQAGADVGAKGGVGLGVCLSVSGEVKAEAGLEGEYRSDGAWYIDGDFNMTMHGSVFGGVGLDDACVGGSAGFSLAMHAEAQKGYNWNTNTGSFFHISVK